MKVDVEGAAYKLFRRCITLALAERFLASASAFPSSLLNLDHNKVPFGEDTEDARQSSKRWTNALKKGAGGKWVL